MIKQLYNLRTLAYGMFAALALTTSCSDDDEVISGGQTPDVTFKDQIEYDHTPAVKIRSAIYEVNADQHYTFYLSPSEGITDVAGMEKANDYLRVMVANPKGTVNTEKDLFEVQYKDISVKKATMNDIASVSLSADLVTETRLNFYLNVEMKSGKTLLSRYENTCTEATVELNNQFNLNRKVSNIQSAIFTVVKGKYSFYFSPTAGIKNLDGMNKANDFVKIVVNEPKGGINSSTDFFEVSYKDMINVTSSAMEDFHLMSLSTALTKEGKAVVSLDMETKSGNRLALLYNEAIVQDYIVLKNQYEAEGNIFEIGSAVVWNNPATGFTHYYLYNKADITTPTPDEQGVEIRIANDLKGEIDLATADPAKVTVRCGKFASAKGATGKINAKLKTDKFGEKIEGLFVDMNIKMNGQVVRAGYDGTFSTGFESTNTIKVTENGKTASAKLVKTFRQEPHKVSNIMAFGDAQKVETPANLTAGHYAVLLKVAPQKFGTVIDATTQKNDYSIEVYDYKTYKTRYVDDIKEGTIQTAANVLDEKMGYIRVNITFYDGVKVESEFYGELTAVDQMPALKPVKPLTPTIVILDKSGKKELLNWDISQMQVRMEKGYRWNGGAEYGGATFDAYVFYFVNKNGNGEVDERHSTPELVLPVSLVEAGKEYDLTQDNPDARWSFWFDLSYDLLSRPGQGYGANFEMYGYVTKLCPDMAKVNVVRNADKSWKLSFQLLDYGCFSNWSTDKSGTQNTLKIVWEGPATKYTGTEKNDLKDDFYK